MHRLTGLACSYRQTAARETQFEPIHHLPSLPELDVRERDLIPCAALGQLPPGHCPKGHVIGADQAAGPAPSNVANIQFVDLAQAKRGGSAVKIGCYSMRVRLPDGPLRKPQQ
jgi:hypothetical protein